MKLTEAAFFIIERIFPHWLDGAGLVHDEVMIGRTSIAVLSGYTGEADTLTSLGVTSSAYCKLRVTAAPLTPVRPEVPESVQTSLALLARHSGLTGTLASGEVALGELTGLATLARQTAVRSVLVEAPMIRLTLVTPHTFYPGQTPALSSPVVTLRSPVQVTVAGPAVLLVDGVTKEPRLQLY